MKKVRVGLSVLLAMVLCAACSGGSFVDRIVIDNPTAFTANVDVVGAERDGWLGLTTVDAHTDSSVEDVYDQGGTWIFRFTYASYSEELTLSRLELVRRDWRVEVPASFEAALRDRGVSPPP
jgi:hypothetical protein